MRPQEIQESRYNFPYHHLPWQDSGTWRPGRFLEWAFEYFGILNSVIELVGKVLSGEKDISVMDFGCGDGRLIVELLSRHPSLNTVVGVDISQRALAFAKALIWDEDRVHLFSDIKQVIRNGLQFDIVIAMEVLEHIPFEELQTIISDIDAVLKENGSLIISVPTKNIPLSRKHYQHFTLESLINLLGSRFRLVEHRYVHRVGILSKIIRKAVVNRFFVANSWVWLRVCTFMYKKFVENANEKTGAHLVSIFEKPK